MNQAPTIFQVRFYLTYTFQRWASNLSHTTTTPPTAANVAAKVQWMVTLMNLSYAQQMDVNLQSFELTSFGETDYPDVNVPSLLCDIAGNLSTFRSWISTNLPAANRKALVHLLRYCTSLSTTTDWAGGIAGYAAVGDLCKTSGGVSAIWGIGSGQFFATLIHEIGMFLTQFYFFILFVSHVNLFPLTLIVLLYFELPHFPFPLFSLPPPHCPLLLAPSLAPSLYIRSPIQYASPIHKRS
jgi:hypothetical protein